MKKPTIALATFVAGIVIGSGSAVAAVTYTEPQEPAWMQKACDPSGVGNSSCYFEHNWVRTFPSQNILCTINERGNAKADYCYPYDETKPFGAPLNFRHWIKTH
jgi:hypothetical protein